jgi:hypothetical protein
MSANTAPLNQQVLNNWLKAPVQKAPASITTPTKAQKRHPTPAKIAALNPAVSSNWS